MRNNIRAFSVIEVLIGIFIFTLGISAIFMLVSSGLNTNTYNKNQIIASNLSREGLELVRNIRDTNYKTLHPWNLIPYHGYYDTINYDDDSNFFQTGSYYIVHNNLNALTTFPVYIKNITTDYAEGVGELDGKMEKYRLCLDSRNLYTHDCSPSGNIKTKFYRSIYIDEVKDVNGVIENAYRVKSKVIFYIKGYHQFELETIITDFKRL